MQKIIDFILENWEADLMLSTLLYEIAVRIWPTEKSRSIITLVFRAINYIVPDRSTVTTEVKKKTVAGRIIEKIIKKHLIVLLVCLSTISFAQNNGGFKALASYNTDSATVRTYINNLQLQYGNVGGLYYNRQSSKWRAYEDSTWIDLIQSGGTTFALTNGSGTTANGTAVDLGGLLTQNANVNGDAQTYNARFTNIDRFDVDNVNTINLSDALAASLTLAGDADLSGNNTSLNGTTSINFTAPTGIFTGHYNFSANATFPGLNVGTFAGDPSAPVNGDVVYNSTTNNLRARINGSWVSLGGGGITNTAAANEMMKSNGTNAVPSGIFSTTDGSALLGNTSDAGTLRSISAQGSDANIQLQILAKGASPLVLRGGTIGILNAGSDRIDIDPGLMRIYNTKVAATDEILDIRGATGLVANPDGDGVSLTGGTGINAGVGGNINITSGTAATSNAPGNINITAANNANLDDSGSIIISAATYTGTGGARVNVLNTGAISLLNANGNGFFIQGQNFEYRDSSGNPILTSNDGATFTIDASFAGEIIFSNLQTDCVGATTGRVYNNAGILSICP